MNWEELKLVNQVRQGVSAWRQSGYSDTTSTTRELINHWTDREEFPLYFAQIDAVLTHIYLRETSPTDITQELERINLKRNDGIDRIAHKMATATGKTPVMAMLILWQAANQYASAIFADAQFFELAVVISTGSATDLPGYGRFPTIFADAQFFELAAIFNGACPSSFPCSSGVGRTLFGF